MSQHTSNPLTAAAAGRPKCGSCGHFVPDADGKTGHCRRYPPHVQIIVVPSRLGGAEPRAQSMWPPMSAENHWCGEHTALPLPLTRTLPFIGDAPCVK